MRNKILILTIILVSSFSIINAQDEDLRGKVYSPGTVQNFKEMLQRYDLVVADFYAEWCTPCKQLHKIIESLAQENEFDAILFVKINTEENRGLVSEYSISSLPTIILFVDGKIINIIYGLHDKKSLKKIIRESFSSHKDRAH